MPLSTSTSLLNMSFCGRVSELQRPIYKVTGLDTAKHTGDACRVCSLPCVSQKPTKVFRYGCIQLGSPNRRTMLRHTPVVGSSKKMTLGRAMKAIATLSLLFIPPLHTGIAHFAYDYQPTSQSTLYSNTMTMCFLISAGISTSRDCLLTPSL